MENRLVDRFSEMYESRGTWNCGEKHDTCANCHLMRLHAVNCKASVFFATDCIIENLKNKGLHQYELQNMRLSILSFTCFPICSTLTLCDDQTKISVCISS